MDNRDPEMLQAFRLEDPDDNGDIPADQVLEYALGHLKDVALVGRMPDGRMYFASNQPSKAEVNWLLDRFKNRLHWED